MEGKLTRQERHDVDAYLSQRRDELTLHDLVDFIGASLSNSESRCVPRRKLKQMPFLTTVESVTQWRCDVFDVAEARQLVKPEKTLSSAQVSPRHGILCMFLGI